MTRLFQAFKHLEKEGGVLVILCSSMQESEDLFEEFERNNVRWYGTSDVCTPLDTKYEMHDNETCYIVMQKSGIKFELLYGRIQTFMSQAEETSEFKNHTIVTAKAFLSNPNIF